MLGLVFTSKTDFNTFSSHFDNSKKKTFKYGYSIGLAKIKNNKFAFAFCDSKNKTVISSIVGAMMSSYDISEVVHFGYATLSDKDFGVYQISNYEVDSNISIDIPKESNDGDWISGDSKIERALRSVIKEKSNFIITNEDLDTIPKKYKDYIWNEDVYPILQTCIIFEKKFFGIEAIFVKNGSVKIEKSIPNLALDVLATYNS